MFKKQNKHSKTSIGKTPFPHQNLISVKDLTEDEVKFIFDLAMDYYGYNRSDGPKLETPLQGLTAINLFLEPSTRTRISFEIAAKRLGMNVVNVGASDSSVTKGESLVDTVRTLWAMKPDLMIVRTSDEALLPKIVEFLECPVINAGDGKNEHPTQALLDAMAIMAELQYRDKFSGFEGLKVTICGDIAHSRVARSNLILLGTLGVNLRVCGPKNLIPEDLQANVGVFETLEDGIRDADVIMMLRYQKERMAKEVSKAEIIKFQLTPALLEKAPEDIVVMHPGPVIYGNEIHEDLLNVEALAPITMQITIGVAIRMALLDILTRPLRGA